MFFNVLGEKSGRPGHFNHIMDADLSPFIVYITSVNGSSKIKELVT